MEASRQQLQSYRANQGPTRPVLEEFIPLKNSSSSDNGGGAEKMAAAAAAANMASDKANWMTSAQLWSDQGNEAAGNKQQAIIGVAASSPKENEIGFSMSPKVGNLDKRNNGGGAFLPFSKDRSSSSCPTPTLALASCDHNSNKDNIEADKKNISEIIVNPSKGNNVNNNNHNGDASTISQPDGQTTTSTAAAATSTQPQRKARRCWSPDLHRRFVNALQMLGGSQGISYIQT